MPKPLDYATPESKHKDRPWTLWVMCVISVAISLCVGVGSLQGAYEFRQYFTNHVIRPGRTSKDLVIDRDLNQIIPPILFGVAALACMACWRRKIGGRLAGVAFSIGVTCWVASLFVYR